MILFVYYEGEKFRGSENFVPLLKILEGYPFPPPHHVMRTDARLYWVESTIASFQDKKLLKWLNPTKRHDKIYDIVIDHLGKNQLEVSIAMREHSSFCLPYLRVFLNIEQIKQLFFEILLAVPLWGWADCGEQPADIYSKYFAESVERPNFLVWLQYFGKVKLAQCGGFAVFESNPYITTQRVHDGLVVQVGESPDYLLTPEGEQLLVNAIRALPPIRE